MTETTSTLRGVPDMVQAIGRTPLVRLRGLPSSPGLLFGKLELLNPFGMKDRAARHIILEARRTGQLREGAPIVESSSGTMASGVALVGRALDHPVHIVTDPRIDAITLARLTALGCVVHIVDRMTQQGWQSARLERLSALLGELPDAYWTRQYENPGNPNGYIGLAEELLEQLDRVDVLVGPVGSGGSLCGTARALRARGMDIRVVAVDAVGSVIFGQPDRPTRLQSGLGNSPAGLRGMRRRARESWRFCPTGAIGTRVRCVQHRLSSRARYTDRGSAPGFAGRSGPRSGRLHLVAR